MLHNLGKFTRLIEQRLHTVKVNLARRTFAQKVGSTANQSNRNEEEPVQFFGSQAALWRARQTRSGGSDEALWYQPYVVSGSLAIFMLYFFILREENDIDRKLDGSLFDHVDGLEELQLALNYKYNKENGLDTKDIEARLIELGIDIKQLQDNNNNLITQ